MKFKTSLQLSWPIEKVFDALLNPKMMQRVAFPIVFFKASDPKKFPKRWEQGETYRMHMFAFGFLPLGWQQLTINGTRSNNSASLQDYGPGFAVKMWDHTVELSSIDSSSTQYEEVLNLKAGMLAPIIWLGMKMLFWWRKKRWISLVNKK